MSCSERGSVLMEFVIVLPIYMLMLGFVFVMGELALQAIHLSSGADRTYAMRQDAFVKFAEAISPHDARETAVENKWNNSADWSKYKNDASEYTYYGDDDATAPVSRYRKDRDDKYADDKVEGTWTKAVVAWVKDDYTLTPLARGFIALWFKEIDRRQELSQDGSVLDIDGETALDKMLNNGIGRAEIKGASMEGRPDEEHGYYCLMRNEYARDPQDKKLRYRAWNAEDLVSGDIWHTKVADDVGFEIFDSDSLREEIEGAKVGKSYPPNHGQGAPGGFPEKEFPDSWTR